MKYIHIRSKHMNRLVANIEQKEIDKLISQMKQISFEQNKNDKKKDESKYEWILWGWTLMIFM